MENQKLPNATAVLVLGILSILTCCFCFCCSYYSLWDIFHPILIPISALFGLILAIVGFYLARKDLIIFNGSPEKFINYKQLIIGKILCIIGILINAIILLMIVLILYNLAFHWGGYMG